MVTITCKEQSDKIVGCEVNQIGGATVVLNLCQYCEVISFVGKTLGYSDLLLLDSLNVPTFLPVILMVSKQTR